MIEIHWVEVAMLSALVGAIGACVGAAALIVVADWLYGPGRKRK